MNAPAEAPIPIDLSTQIEAHWSIGQVRGIRRMAGGLVNQTFRIDTTAISSCILRLYRPDMTPVQIQREHDLLGRLAEVDFALSPRLIAPVSPPSWRTLAAPVEDCRHMALMTRLPGDDPYAWDRPPRNPKVTQTLGDTLSRYHRAVYGWRAAPGGAAACETDMVKRLTAGFGEDPLAGRVLERLAANLNNLDREAWPALVVHGDFHAANVRWQGDTISGLFDFEYAAVNWRLYDVATALACLATSRSSPDEGALRMDRLQAFLAGYEDNSTPIAALPPLLPTEREALPIYLEMAQLLTLEWALAPLTRRRLGAAVAHRYAQNARRSLTWLLENTIAV